METVVVSDMCTGCGNCLFVCPVNAINIKVGFVDGYFSRNIAKIDNDICIDCNQCSEVCPEHAIFPAWSLVGPGQGNDDSGSDSGSGSGSNGGQNNNGSSSPFIIDFPCQSSVSFENDFRETVRELNLSCFNEKIFAKIKVKQNNNKANAIHVCYSPAASGASGSYNPATNSIGYIHDYIHSSILLHESIHALQNIGNYYTNMANMGRNQDTGVANPGFANLEFETMLIINIGEGYGDSYLNEIKGGGDYPHSLINLENEYNSWIRSFTDINDNYLNYNQINWSDFDTKYNYFLDIYSKYSKNYKSELLSIDPLLIKDLLKNMANCKIVR